MDEAFLGSIVLFAGNFPPRNWAFCNGQLLQIASNTALFAILGTTYGGDGRTTFALPDLRGRVPVHAGESVGPGLPAVVLGELAGSPAVTLLANIGVAPVPANTPGVVGVFGGEQSVPVMQPYLGLNYIICTVGLFPTRE
jgi:microcystin-dependent protein